MEYDSFSLHVPQWNVKGLLENKVTRAELNATAASLLGFLHEGEQSGWDLVVTARRLIGNFWSLTQSQIYRELAAMAAQGLVVADDVGARDRRPYRITDDGRAAFQRWLAASPGPGQIRYPLLLTLSFAQHLPPEQVSAFVAEHRAAHQRKHAGYLADTAMARNAGASATDLVTLDFGIRYEAAVLDWFEHLPEQLTGRPPDQ